MTADELAVAQTAWGEARSLGENGMRAIACVIMNRVKKQTWYGLTPREVCMKHARLKSGKVVYQFDCNDPTDPNCSKCQKVTPDDPQFAQAIQIAAAACNGTLIDITNGALNYYSTTVPLPSWAEGKTPCLTIGNTIFFNNIN